MYLVTVGTGFIGPNLVATLRARGTRAMMADRPGSDDRRRDPATARSELPLEEGVRRENFPTQEDAHR
jgi:nucleoside-diphosphate-sugar epimerase